MCRILRFVNVVCPAFSCRIGNDLFVGTSEGNLIVVEIDTTTGGNLVCNLLLTSDSDPETPHSSLKKVLSTTGKKPITQICAVPKLKLLLLLCGMLLFFA